MLAGAARRSISPRSPARSCALDLDRHRLPARRALAGAALVVPGRRRRRATRGKPPKYVVFWIMDSLRADRVRAVQPERAARDARSATSWPRARRVFTQIYVQGNESQVLARVDVDLAVPGQPQDDPAQKDMLDAKWTTIDEVAKAAGMYAAGVSANGYITPKRGFGDGWDAFSNHIHERRRRSAPRTSSSTA